jgi:hypothetical protein
VASAASLLCDVADGPEPVVLTDEAPDPSRDFIHLPER